MKTVIDPPLRYMEFTWCSWEEVLGMHQSTFTPSEVSGPRLEIPFALVVHGNSPLMFSLVIFLLTGCHDLFFLFYSFTGLFRVKFMPYFSSI